MDIVVSVGFKGCKIFLKIQNFVKSVTKHAQIYSKIMFCVVKCFFTSRKTFFFYKLQILMGNRVLMKLNVVASSKLLGNIPYLQIYTKL